MKKIKEANMAAYCFIAAFFLVVIMAFTQEQEKKYTVTLSVQEWQYVINAIDSKSVSSLLEKQLIPQIQAEQAKAATVKKK